MIFDKIWDTLPTPVCNVETDLNRFRVDAPVMRGFLDTDVKFFSFRVSVHTYLDNALINDERAVLSLFLLKDGWVYTISNEVSMGSLAKPMLAGRSTEELAERLAKGDFGELTVTSADGEPIKVRFLPITPELN